MCNLYSITTNQAAIIALFRIINRYVGNLAPMPGVFPDFPAPVIRYTDTGTEITLMRWGMLPPPRTGGPPVTNIRNTSSCGFCVRLDVRRDDLQSLGEEQHGPARADHAVPKMAMRRMGLVSVALGICHLLSFRSACTRRISRVLPAGAAGCRVAAGREARSRGRPPCCCCC
jgi:hypothetical protein